MIAEIFVRGIRVSGHVEKQEGTAGATLGGYMDTGPDSIIKCIDEDCTSASGIFYYYLPNAAEKIASRYRTFSISSYCSNDSEQKEIDAIISGCVNGLFQYLLNIRDESPNSKFVWRSAVSVSVDEEMASLDLYDRSIDCRTGRKRIRARARLAVVPKDAILDRGDEPGSGAA